jgi:hypothetical protein
MMKNNSLLLAERFEYIISSHFKLREFLVERGETFDQGFDLKVTRGKIYYIEIKFYRSNRIHYSLIERAVSQLAKLVGPMGGDNYGIAIFNIDISIEIRFILKEKFGITIWDREILLDELGKTSIELKEDFERLLLESQQGTETYNMLSGNEVSSALQEDLFPKDKPIDPGPLPNPDHLMADELRARLAALPCGKDHWSAYEKLMLDILKFLFRKDLTLWEKQQRTDDELSRFDLICRITFFDDFWKSLAQSFNTRFILFEFKNYCQEVTQHAVYLTERYLYKNALRSVAVIISRDGPNDSAVQAAKGALRESGKLMFFLSDADVTNMLDGIKQEMNPNDYLADILDDWLVGLSR